MADDLEKKVFVHESSYVDSGVQIGEGTKIWHFSHIQKGARIGKNCVLGQGVNVGEGVYIGDDCKIQNGVSVYEGVTLEEGVFCGPHMTFTNVPVPRAKYPQKGKFVPTLVKSGASIGAHSTILCGTTIGRCAFIGAHSFVNKDVSDYALMVGVPARRIGWRSERGQKLEFDAEGYARCELGDKEYILEAGVVRIIE